MKGSAVSRIHLLSIGTLLFAVLLTAKLYTVQIVRSEAFSDEADRQYVRKQEDAFNRGSIFFTDKNGERISAATLRSGFSVAINPMHVIDPEETFEALSMLLPLERPDFFARAGKKGDTHEPIAARVSVETAEKIKALTLSGVVVSREKWRYYPGESMAAHVLGFVGFQGDTLAGRYGLERQYDAALSRESEKLYVNFFAEMFANISKTLLPSHKREGSLILTIDPKVQAVLEDELRKMLDTWEGKSAGGIIIHPETGALYAMSAMPSFNPNTFNTEGDIAHFANPLVENVFEMGSIIKPLTMAIGLDTKSVNAQTTYEDKGSITVGDATVSNYDGIARGVVDMQEVLNESLNTGVVFVESHVGNHTFSEYLLSFGIGEETGIDLPNETHGLVDNLESHQDIEYVTASFGQGIALTPIGTVRALASLANGGLLIEPHVVAATDYEVGLVHEYEPPVPKRVLERTTSEEITRMLVRVVDEALLGGTVAMERHSIAAKTGTAQIANMEEGGYYEDRFLHSFFGYFPAYNPEFLVFLYMKEPKEVRYASRTLTAPFMDIAKFLLNYYEVPPDR